MKTNSFRIVFDRDILGKTVHGGEQDELALANALYEAGLDDCSFLIDGGEPCLDCDVENAQSLKEAVRSVLRRISKCGKPFRVARLEPGNLVTPSEIARRLGVSRQHIQQLIFGLRGPGGFPQPFCRVSDKSAVYQWTDVVHWMQAHQYLKKAEIVKNAEEMEKLNRNLATAVMA